MTMSFKANGLSRMQIRQMAFQLRKLFGLEDIIYIDILQLLENVLTLIGLDYEVISTDKMKLEAVTLPNENRILIREDVYNLAAKGQGRARFTIAHEIGHILLHSDKHVSYARGEIPKYCDPEWQADAFAGEFLMPYHLVKNMPYQQIAKECRTSLAAARYQAEQYNKKDRLV